MITDSTLLFFIVSTFGRFPARYAWISCATGGLLHAAVVAVGILEPQTHLGPVFLEVKKLSGVKGSTSLPRKADKTKLR